MTGAKGGPGAAARANKIFIVSDGTGRTASQALAAALVQFRGATVDIVVRPCIRTKREVLEVVREAAEAGAFVVHTIVTPAVRESLVQAGRELNVEAIDLMGPLVARLTETLAVSPSEKPGLFAQLNKSYFRRVETMDFALRHDDGQRVEDLRRAEIVLLGVSRTFKTPLSIYLAFKGWFVANVPVTLEQEPPAQLARLPARKVFCLDTSARLLAELRRSRADHLGGAVPAYADPEYVRIELMRARQYFAKHPRWAVVNVTNKPIEEIATEILAVRGASGTKKVLIPISGSPSPRLRSGIASSSPDPLGTSPVGPPARGGSPSATGIVEANSRPASRAYPANRKRAKKKGGDDLT